MGNFYSLLILVLEFGVWVDFALGLCSQGGEWMGFLLLFIVFILRKQKELYWMKKDDDFRLSCVTPSQV